MLHEHAFQRMIWKKQEPWQNKNIEAVQNLITIEGHRTKEKHAQNATCKAVKQATRGMTCT